MKTDIHPKYHLEAQIVCSCGNIIVAGSTREKLKTELCSNCHPFYTGQQKLVDTAGRVDKFQAKRQKAVSLKEEAAKHAESRKKKPEAYKEKEIPQEVLERAMIGAPAKEGKWGGALGDSPAEEVAKDAAAATKKPAKAKKAPVKKAAKKGAQGILSL